MMLHSVRDRFSYGLTFVRTVSQVAAAAATRESEYRKAYEERLGEVRQAIGDLPVEDVLAAAAYSGLTVSAEVAKVMSAARLCAAERGLAEELGFIAAQLRAEPDGQRQLTLIQPDMYIFRPYDARFLADGLPKDNIFDPRNPSPYDGAFDLGGRVRQVRHAHGDAGVVGTVAEYVAVSKAERAGGRGGSLLGGA
jgi:hypothetical protein